MGLFGRRANRQEALQPEDGATITTGGRQVLMTAFAGLIRLRTPDLDHSKNDNVTANTRAGDLDIANVQGGYF